MTEFAAMLAALRRPKILIRAARAGLADYRRERDLKRLVRAGAAGSRQALGSLIAAERDLDEARAAGEATYSIQRHVAVLTALLAEIRLSPAGGASRA